MARNLTVQEATSTSMCGRDVIVVDVLASVCLCLGLLVSVCVCVAVG